MKSAVLLVVWSVTCAAVPAAAQQGQAARSRAAQPAQSDKTAEAYAQFLLGHHLDEQEDEAGAIAAYKRAMDLDPLAADIPGELAAVYLRQNKVQEAMTAAEQALKIAPANREANRVLGVIYAAMADTGRDREAPRSRGSNQADRNENAAKAIDHLELAIKGLTGEADPNVRATLSRLYVNTGQYDKAIPLLSNLVNEQPGWQEGPLLLAEAYASSGRSSDAIAWLEERVDDDPRLLPTLGDLYERERRWKDAADVYSRAMQRAPRNTELRARYASALVNAGGRDNLTKARDVLADLTEAPGANERLRYLLAQAQRRLGDSQAAEATARKMIAQSSKSPWGYYALAEALEERHQYQTIIDELTPAIAEFRARPAAVPFAAGMLLPHLAFAHQRLGQYEQAITAFEEAYKLSPKDAAVASYLVEANIDAKRYTAAIDLAKAALVDHPNDMRLMRLQSQALRQSGKADLAVALLEQAVRNNANDPNGYIALAQIYSDTDRGPQAVKVLQDAQAKFPADTSITFELGATFDKQKKFVDAEAAFKQVIARDPQHAAALNYLGYMLAERGERLDESVRYVKQALELDPDNGSYLDSLGWAYYKADKLDLAEDNLRRAADQLKTNSVVQDHYGDVLLKLGRVDDAIGAWNRALSGDGESIDRTEIDRKIRSAKQRLPKR